MAAAAPILLPIASAQIAGGANASFNLTKQMDFAQTGPRQLSVRKATFQVHGNIRPTLPNATTTLVVKGVSHSLSGGINPSFERSYPTTAELELNFPSSETATLTTRWTGGSETFTTLIPAPVSVAPLPPVLNFEELQAWEGGQLVISTQPAVLSQPSGGPVQRPAIAIYRATNIDFTADRTLLASDTVSTVDNTRVVFIGINAAPGETLYGEIQFPQGFGSGGSIRFPIRRRADDAPAILAQPQS